MWIAECDDVFEKVCERFGRVVQSLFAPPGCPSALGMVGEASEGLRERAGLDLAVCGDSPDRLGQIVGVEFSAREFGDVNEVSPTSIGSASLQGGDNFLGKDQFDSVAGNGDWGPTEESGKLDELWFGPERIANVEVDVEPDPSSGQSARYLGSGPGVDVIFTDRFDCCGSLIELEAVVEFDGEDFVGDRSKRGEISVDVGSCEVDVSSGPAGVEGGQENPAFENQIVGMLRGGEPTEETLEGIELEQLIGGTPKVSGELAEIKVGDAGGAGRQGLAVTAAFRGSIGLPERTWGSDWPFPEAQPAGFP